jgi:transcriptional regulator with XRE-family HTH domain
MPNPTAKWNVLLNWLKEKKLSQRDLAQRIKVSTGALNHWINGRWAPDLVNLKALSSETGISLDVLVDSLPKPTK